MSLINSAFVTLESEQKNESFFSHQDGLVFEQLFILNNTYYVIRYVISITPAGPNTTYASVYILSLKYSPIQNLDLKDASIQVSMITSYVTETGKIDIKDIITSLKTSTVVSPDAGSVTYNILSASLNIILEYVVTPRVGTRAFDLTTQLFVILHNVVIDIVPQNAVLASKSDVIKNKLCISREGVFWSSDEIFILIRAMTDLYGGENLAQSVFVVEDSIPHKIILCTDTVTKVNNDMYQTSRFNSSGFGRTMYFN